MEHVPKRVALLAAGRAFFNKRPQLVLQTLKEIGGKKIADDNAAVGFDHRNDLAEGRFGRECYQRRRAPIRVSANAFIEMPN